MRRIGEAANVRRSVCIIGGILLSVLTAVPAWSAEEGAKGTSETHLKTSGVVTKVQPSHVTIKTPWGQMTIASTTGPQNLKVGEEVELHVNENNAVVDVHRKGEAVHHHYLTGKLVYASPDKKAIKLWTPDGEKTFEVKTGKSKLSAVKEGTQVTVELNEDGKVIDVHRVTVEMIFDEQPRTKPGYHIQVHGVVDKIQSGVVTIKAPGGTYRIPAKSMQSDLKAGDEVTLWINNENMVIDHHRKGHGAAHRLISGKLIYAGKTKSEIKIWTPEGEKVFPLGRMEVKTKPIPEGASIVVELNEDGTVIDLWKI